MCVLYVCVQFFHLYYAGRSFSQLCLTFQLDYHRKSTVDLFVSSKSLLDSQTLVI